MTDLDYCPTCQATPCHAPHVPLLPIRDEHGKRRDFMGALGALIALFILAWFIILVVVAVSA